MVTKELHRFKSWYILITLVLCLAESAASQTVVPPDSVDLGLGGNNIITGTVANSAGQRIETRVSVRLATMTRGDVITVTNEKGVFYFRGLPPGNYSIVIDKEKDFESFTQRVEIIQFRGTPPIVQNVNIRLAPKAKPETITAVVDSGLGSVPPKAIESYDRAIELSKAGNHASAIEALQVAISEYPDFMLAHNELGVQYLRLNNLNKADESLLRALEINPDAFMPIVNRGIVLFTMKRFDEAEPLLLKAVKQDGDSPVVRYFLGQTLANLGKFDEAEKELVIALELGGDEMREAHRVLAIIYSSRGNKKGAADELETYLQRFPKAPDAEQLQQVIKNLRGSAGNDPANP